MGPQHDTQEITQYGTIPARLLSFAAKRPLLLLAAAALILFPILTLLQVILSPLRSLPGPITARLTRLWYFTKVWQGSFHKDNVKLHEKYGESFRRGLTRGE